MRTNQFSLPQLIPWGGMKQGVGYTQIVGERGYTTHEESRSQKHFSQVLRLGKLATLTASLLCGLSMRERDEKVARGAHNIYQLLEPALLTMDVPADQGDHSTAEGTLSRMRRVK